MTQDSPPNTPGQTYNAVADKIGLIPNVRLKDNLIQGIVVAAVALVGSVVGFLTAPPSQHYQWVCYGAIAGLVAGGVVSGLVLMVVGILRKR